MTSSRRYLFALIFLVIPIAAALMFPFAGGAAPGAHKEMQSQSASVRELPNYDAFGASTRRLEQQRSAQDQAQPQSEGGHLIQYEPRLAVPTFLWASESARGPALSMRSITDQAGPKTGGLESVARDHLGRYGAKYRLAAEDVANARLASIHDTGKGPIIVKFKQEVGGVEVFRDEVAVIMNRDQQLIAIAGYLTGGNDSAVPAFSVQATEAITKALTNLTGSTINQSILKPTTKASSASGYQDRYQYFTAGKDQTPGFMLGDLVRSKQVMYHLVDQYIPSYYIEANVLIPVPDSTRVDLSGNSQTDWVTEAYSYVISALDGQILFRKNLTQNDVYTYRVFADPTTRIPYDSPAGNAAHPKIVASPDGVQYPFLSPNDITLQNYPFSRNDPWLPPGATETIGNNVDAYVDLFNPDGLNPAGSPGDPATADFRAQITSAGQFLHTHTPDSEPKLSEPRQGTIQQLFYDVNFLHDWYYEAGFDETSGNAQASNYARGGAENDRLHAEGQDVSSRNTSNMLTPADGASPRMQMFLFDANSIKYFDVLSPEAAAGQRDVGTAQFGAQAFDSTNTVVQPSPAGGCTAASFTGTAGKFVLVDREPTSGAGSCSIGTKLNNAMAAGAAGFILVNLSTTPNAVVSVSGALPTFTIPFLSISWNGAAAIKTELAVPNVVTARMRRDAGPDRDGGIDNQGVFHEWGHYLSNRLIGNSAGLVSSQSQAMGEGWGDFNALLLTVRQDDAAVPSNANFDGVYALSTYVSSGGNNNGYYYGNRRYPYSTDLTRNPLTLKHIQASEPLPVGPPRNPNQTISTNNAEPHNTGEVWAAMLWECYASLLRDTQGASPRLTFQEAQTRMKYYLVAALKTTPSSPTILDGRDALLAAASATDQVDYQHFWAAFAKRGAGFGAVIPDRFTFDNNGVTESFSVASDASFTGATLDDLVTSCDHDGVLDTGETGHLVLNLRNIGLNTLTGTTGTVTSSTPGITLSNGGNVTFGSFKPASNASASIDVAFATGIAGVQSLDFQFTYNDPQLPSPHIVSFSIRGNTNSIPASTATDTVEIGTSPWTATSVPPTIVTGGVTTVVGVASPFRIKEVNALQHVWHVDDLGIYTDERFNSPFFTIDGSGSFNLQFDHSWAFEFDGGGNYDGGVVEISVNGGVFTDLGAPAYNGTILNQGSGSPNPLRGRTGFVKNSGGTIHTSLTQAIAPGSIVQIRFREGSDGSVGSGGWDIDNLAFTGVVETPFTTLVADAGSCPGPLPTPVVLQLTPNSLPAGTLNVVYPTTVLTASGGNAPYTYTLTPFGLPPGLVRDVVGGNLQISGTPTLAGTYPVTVVVNDNAGHQKSFNYSITVSRLDPNVTWNNPVDITFGTALSGTQLNATAGVPGTFSYTPPAGTILNGGNSQTLSVNFVPSDTNYKSVTKNVAINVQKATPTITWSNAADITYGAALSGTQLNALASVPGVLTYTPASGTVLNAGNAQLLSVDFVPTDTTNYNNTAKNVLINVLKATPAITWNNPADIAYGTALSATQLNASASVPGVLTYTPPATTVMNGGNGQTLSVNFVPTDTTNYNNNSKNVLINVTKANQTISFGVLSTKTFGDADFSISATASSSLTVDFTATGSCTVSGSTVHLTGAGSCTITASQVGDTNYNAATSVPRTFAVAKATQTITFGVISTKTYGDADFSLNATASSSLTVSFAAAGSCTVSNNTVHLTSAGSCMITASQGGDSNYDSAANVAQGFAIDKGAQTITFGPLMAKTVGDADFNISATASSNLGVSFTATGSCTVSASTVHLTGAGSCTITASQGGNSDYNAAANVNQTFAVDKANQTISFATLLAKTVGDADFNVSATASSNLIVTFAAAGNCTVSGNTVHLTGAGSCTITAAQGGDQNFNAAANVAQTFAVDKANQTITFAALPAKTFGDADFNVSATASSNLAVNFAATGNCTIAGNIVHLTGGGTCTITASQAGDNNYNAATNVAHVFAVDKANQTITFGALSTRTYGDADFSANATASSNLTIAYVATGNCTVSSNTVHLTGAGSCTITASQGGDTNYNAAVNVAQTFAVDKANQTITFGGLSTRTFGDADFNVSATASSNLAVSLAASGTCTVGGNTVHLAGAGSCTLTASQVGDNNFNAAANVGQTFAVDKGNQTITFGVISTKIFGDADFNVSTTASSNLTVSLAATGSCTLSGNTVHLTGAGSCTITAAQAGDANYNGAANVVQTFAVDKASQTIAFGSLPVKTYGDADFNVSASASSTFTVSFAATGNCAISGNTVHLTGAGSCTITASQVGDANYNAAPSIPQTFAIDKANQTVTFATLPAKTFGDPDFDVSATASSNLTVVFAATGSCTITGNTIHVNGGGSCTITASQAGDSNYNPAATPQTFAIDKANQTITFATLPAATFGDPDFNVSATSSANLTVALAATGSCTVTGSTVHLTGAGSCTITASQAGDPNYNAAANVPQTFAVGKANQTITFATLPAKTFGDPDFNVSATTSSNLIVALAATGSCTVTGSTVHLTGAGSCTITASQAGDTNYNAAANIPQTFAVDKANQTITFAALPAKTFGDADFNVSTTASSNLTVALAATGNCTITGSTVHLTGAGSCTITASQAGDTNYNAAASVPQTFAVDKASQTITFASLAAKTFGDADFNASATATSNLTVTFAAAGNCTVSGNSVRLTGAGSCTITASQAGDNNNKAAGDVPEMFSISRAASATGVTSSLNPADFGHTVSLSANVTATAGTPTGTVQFKDNGTSIGGPQTLTSGQATFATSALTVGAHTITAEYSGDANFNISSGVLLNAQVVNGLPSLSISDVSLTEGNTGSKAAEFVATLSSTSTLPVTVSFATADGTATAPADYLSASDSLTFAPGETTKTISVIIIGDQSFEPDENFFVNLSGATNAMIGDSQGLASILDDDSQGGIFRFGAAHYTVAEEGRLLTVTVTRTGDTSGAATVDYTTGDDNDPDNPVFCATANGLASSRCDFTMAAGTLKFAAGDTARTFDVLISQDSFVEGAETFPITLSHPTGGATLGSPATTSVTITDDVIESTTNPIDDADTFVRQQYHDFLNRESDPAGQAFWVSRITDCGSDAACVARQRISVSAAFFIAQEFQQTSFYVYRTYKGALGRRPGYQEFIADRSELQANPDLDAEKVAYTLTFVQRAEFTGRYSLATTAGAFVDALIENVQTASGIDITARRPELLAAYNAGSNRTDSRARTLRTLIDHPNFQTAEYNRGFVLAQYFSYLRREPDPGGYNFWVSVLNSNPNAFGGMVCSFITSAEYQDRFGLLHSHSNAECSGAVGE